MTYAVLKPKKTSAHEILMRKIDDYLTYLRSALVTDVGKAIKLLKNEFGIDWPKDVLEVVIRKIMLKHKDRFTDVAIKSIDDVDTEIAKHKTELKNKKNTTPIKIKPWHYIVASEAIMKFVRQKEKQKFAGKKALRKTIAKVTNQQISEVTRQIYQTVRASVDIHRISISAVAKAKQLDPKLPSMIKKISQKATRIDRLTSGIHHEDIVRLRKYASRLQEGGRMQKAYMRLADKLTKDGTCIETAMQQLAVEKQKYIAERIMVTETNNAYRTAQHTLIKSMPNVIGFRWQYNGTGKGSCICPVMSGKVLRKEPDEISVWLNGAHPNCVCTFQPIIQT